MSGGKELQGQSLDSESNAISRNLKLKDSNQMVRSRIERLRHQLNRQFLETDQDIVS